ncbi:hypothetical protein PoB_001613000 [Plakobranchus ocellatus]|uniref:Uncharacterized protein n=1 Tax=Plakobranchus ocellatus TaxID=259542 RepID=A0AAV3Z379_9GAST|nr:hypothetical protein PoB_001613000 [Plakobranchus ocellatus]
MSEVQMVLDIFLIHDCPYTILLDVQAGTSNNRQTPVRVKRLDIFLIHDCPYTILLDVQAGASNKGQRPMRVKWFGHLFHTSVLKPSCLMYRLERPTIEKHQ